MSRSSAQPLQNAQESDVIKYVPGKGWINTNGGNEYVIGGAEDEAKGDAYRQKQADWHGTIGNYDQYKDGKLDDLAALVNGDNFWDVRLHKHANEVRDGNSQWWLRNFSAGDRGYKATEILNRFLGLQDQGYSDEAIMRGIYGENWGKLNPNWMDTGNPDNFAGGSPTFQSSGSPPANSGGSSPANSGGSPPNAGIVPGQRGERLGTWGSGFSDGGYSVSDARSLMSDDTGFFGGGSGSLRMFSEENQAMRKLIGDHLEKKLLG